MDFPSHIPFVQLLGIELVSAGEGRSHLRLAMREELENHLHLAHGGVVMTLLDVALAQAARYFPGADDAAAAAHSVITIEMKTTFLQPSLGMLQAHGRLLHRTGRLAFVEGSVVDAEGKTCAHATGTFRYVVRKTSNQPVE